MIRTRDLAIFLVILFVLGCGIGVTLLISKQQIFSDTALVLLDSADDVSLFEAESEHITRNRTDAIQKMRALLASDKSTITPSPSVEETQAEEPVPFASDGTQNTTASLERCSVADDTFYIAREWPLRDLTLEVVGGDRVVHFITQQFDETSSSTASSSQPDVITKTLLSMRAYPVKQMQASCVPGEVVGVTLSGALIHNSDAPLYSQSTEVDLLGYARDGFPIYGMYQGEVDTCGGYQHSSGYRYTLSPDRTYVLGCYFGTPSKFVMP